MDHVLSVSREKHLSRILCCAIAGLFAFTGSVHAGQRVTDPGLSLRDSAVGILTFENLSQISADEWIGRGMVETLASELQHLYGTEVRGRDVFGQTDVTVEAALKFCRELGAAWLITGAYQHVSGYLRVTAKVVDVETGAAVHAVKVDGTVEELFELQDRMIAAIGGQFTTTRSLGPTLALTGLSPPSFPTSGSQVAVGDLEVEAIRLMTPLELDGRLDEEMYTHVSPRSDFIQQEPQEGLPATEKTEVWVFFDQDYVYLSFRCWESEPERVIASEMRRDHFNVYQNDHIAFILDPFYDRRNGLEFLINPIGGIMDGQITDERLYAEDWNPVWDWAVGQFDGGWTVETAIPFKSIRYRSGENQVWGLNVRRVNVWKSEHSFLAPVPSSLGDQGIFQVSRAATLVGLEAPRHTTNLDLKPFVISDLSSAPNMTPKISNELGGDVGIDVKYGVTQNFVADFTVNTDFAQVEADQQQVNLTRFSLFFPEKREFFLENEGVFAFGGAGTGPFGGGGSTPILFYSRRIGLQDGQEVPIHAGGRLTGRAGGLSVGVMNLQTADVPTVNAESTNFSVVRVKHDIFRRSSIGAIFTGRSVSTLGNGSSETYGLDGTFAFYDNLNINTYWAKTETPGLRGDDVSYRTQLEYMGDRYAVQVERLIVGDDFNPEVGFLQRDDFERSFGMFRFSPRPASISAIRKLIWEGRLDYFTDRAGTLETRQAQGVFGIQFENSDQFKATYSRNYEFLDRPFQIASDVAIPVGGYGFEDVELAYFFGNQRRVAGGVVVQHGDFYGGEKTTLGFGLQEGFSSGRLEVTPSLSIEPGLSFNRISLPEGRFTTQLVTNRTTYTVNPRMFVSALLQYNSSNNSVAANVRLRWEYQGGSELFVVYNEQRDTLTPRFPGLANRSVIIKINRLFRF